MRSRNDPSFLARIRRILGPEPRPLAQPAPASPLVADTEFVSDESVAAHSLFSIRMLPPNYAETPAQALTNLLNLLGTFLDTSVTPTPSVYAVSVIERPLGVGNHEGIDPGDPLGVVEIKGRRLEVIARFELTGADALAVNNRVTTLQGELLALKDTLFTQGVLKITSLDSSLAEENPAGSGNWRRTTDYRVLYEYQYADTDNALGLITRIEAGDVGPGEMMVITRADTVRWGNETAANLVLRHGTRVSAIDIWACLPAAWDGAAVTLIANSNGVITQQNFTTLRDFVNAFDLASEQVLLGTNAFSVGRMSFPNAAFPNPIILSGGANEFRIEYAEESLNGEAIVYLRVQGG